MMRCAFWVFGTAVLVRAAYLLAIYSGEGSLVHVDSQMWLDFGAEPSRWLGNHERMPLYPLYLGLFNAVFGRDPLPPVIGQIFVDAATCVLIARMAGTLDRRLTLVAGLLAALNPTQIVMSCVLLGDTLFIFFVAGTLAAGLRWLRASDPRDALAMGLWGGLALANRSLVWPMLALAPVGMLVVAWLRRLGWRRILLGVTAFAAAAACFAGPIVLRNRIDHGVWALSSQFGAHSANWIVPLVQQTKDGTPFDDSQAAARRFVREKDPDFDLRDPFVQAREWSAYTRDQLAELGIAAIAQAWIAGAAINFFSPAVLMSPPLMALPRTGYYATPGTGNIEKMTNFLFRNDNVAYARWLAFGAAIEVPLKLLALLGLAAGLIERDTRLATLFLVTWIAYILVASGPVASAKYRLPIEPACVIAVAMAVTWRRRTKDAL